MASAVEKRLKEREEARRAAVEQSKLERDGEKRKEETQEYFYSRFTKLNQEIEEMLDCASSQTNMKDHFDQVGQKLQSLQKLLSDASLFLPSYNLRTSQQKINELKQSVQAKQDELLPRKKFAFNSRKKTVPQQQVNTKPPSSKESEQKNHNVSAADTSVAAKVPHNTIDIRDRSSTSISLTPQEGYDVSLTNLESCIVEITGSPGTVHISKVTDTKLLCGPVKGSVFIEDCTGCQVVVACQQLRIHSTTQTDFYLHVTSKAIIEDSSGVRFAPYNWDYPDISIHYKDSGLSTDVNNWDQVDDFNWLTSKEHSPNWSIVPEETRTKTWSVDYEICSFYCCFKVKCSKYFGQQHFVERQ